jgi:flagellar basal-body rod protein FlgF
MDRMLYIAMNGAKQTLLAQTTNDHNLANANTSGFRADLEAFRAMPVFGPGYPTRVYAMASQPGVDFAPGTISATGRDLDVAINGRGWIAVQAPDGSEAYTRAGDLRIDPAGRLVTGAGHPVLGNAGPIAIPPAEKIEIAADGTISIRAAGQAASALATIDRIKLVDPPAASLVKGADGLLRRRDGAAAEADAQVQLTAGSLEGSNANPVEAMVNLITLARQFELQVRMMRTAAENDAAAAQLLRLA